MSFLTNLTVPVTNGANIENILVESGLDYDIVITRMPLQCVTSNGETITMPDYFAVGRKIPATDTHSETFLPFVPVKARMAVTTPRFVAENVLQPLILSGLTVKRAACFAEGRAFIFVMNLLRLKTARNTYRTELLVSDSCDQSARLAVSVALTNEATRQTLVLPLKYTMKHTASLRMKIEDAGVLIDSVKDDALKIIQSVMLLEAMRLTPHQAENMLTNFLGKKTHKKGSKTGEQTERSKNEIEMILANGAALGNDAMSLVFGFNSYKDDSLREQEASKFTGNERSVRMLPSLYAQSPMNQTLALLNKLADNASAMGIVPATYEIFDEVGKDFIDIEAETIVGDMDDSVYDMPALVSTTASGYLSMAASA